MKNVLKFAAIIAIFATVACQKTDIAKDNVTPEEANNQTVEVAENPILNVGDIIDAATLANVADTKVPDAIRNLPHTPSPEEMALKTSLSNNTEVSTRAVSKRAQVFAYLYCESKGGDDGSTLEFRGTVKANIINNLGKIIAPPTVGKSLLMNVPNNRYYAVRPLQTISLGSATFSVAAPTSTRLALQGQLWDEDVNADDGYFPNADDYMGANNSYIYVSAAMANYPTTVWQRYVDGNQIGWVKYIIYVY